MRTLYITPELLEKNGLNVNLEQTDCIVMSTELIPKILPHLSEFKGKISFKKIGKHCDHYIINKRLYLAGPQGWILKDLMLSCQSWISSLYLRESFPYPIFEEVEFSNLSTIYASHNWEPLLGFLKASYQTIETIHVTSPHIIIYEITQLGIVFPKLKRIYNTVSSSSWPSKWYEKDVERFYTCFPSVIRIVSPHCKLPELQQISNGDYTIEKTGKLFLCKVAVEKKHVALTWLSIYLQKRVPRDIQGVILGYAKKISPKYWERCVTYFFPDKNIVFLSDEELRNERNIRYFRLMLEERYKDTECLKEEIEDIKDSIQNYENLTLESLNKKQKF